MQSSRARRAFPLRDYRSSILVAALSSAFGTALLSCTSVLGAYIGASSMGRHSSVQVDLVIVAAVFFVIAVYVGSIVTTNTFATIVAGRTRTIALLRLIGSSAQAQRRAVAREGLIVGIVGALIGAVIAIGLALLTVSVLTSGGVLPGAAYPVLTPSLIAPPTIVVVTTWLSSWVGSRRVLSVTPIHALGAAEERPLERIRSRGRAAIAAALTLSGATLLALGLAAGLGMFARSSIGVLAMSSHYALLAGLLGGVLSFTGIILAAPQFMPFILRTVGRLLGRGAAGRLAAANAERNPERSSRTAIGLVIGVTLITMFVVAASTWIEMISSAAAKEPGEYAGAANILTITMSVFSGLVGFSAVIAAVGVVNSLSLSVLQRTRELGLLRALGFSRQQVRQMILAESVQLTVSAVLTGLILGTAYGWIGAQTLLGSIPAGGLLPPAMPWQFILLIAGLASALALIASVAPTRRATQVSPVTALAVE
ncbi:hypothetical protein GCM10027568_09070 [Humibacter soli]